jgi:hypothetical protein
MTETIDLICNRCKNTNPYRAGCEAFPEDIPIEILLTNEHSIPLPGQKNNIVFEPIIEENLTT